MVGTMPMAHGHYRIYTAGRVREKGVFLPKGAGAATGRKWRDMTPEERRAAPRRWGAQIGPGAIAFHPHAHPPTRDPGGGRVRPLLHRHVGLGARGEER